MCVCDPVLTERISRKLTCAKRTVCCWACWQSNSSRAAHECEPWLNAVEDKVVACAIDGQKAFQWFARTRAEDATYDEFKKHMRLSYAQTYASCQGTEFDGTLRLHDTWNKHFTKRHLFVGLSRGKRAQDISVV